MTKQELMAQKDELSYLEKVSKRSVFEIMLLAKNAAICDYSIGLLSPKRVAICLANSFKEFANFLGCFKSRSAKEYQTARRLFIFAYLEQVCAIQKAVTN